MNDLAKQIESKIEEIAQFTSDNMHEAFKFVIWLSNLEKTYSNEHGLIKVGMIQAVTSNLVVGRENIVPIYKKPWGDVAEMDMYSTVGCLTGIEPATFGTTIRRSSP